MSASYENSSCNQDEYQESDVPLSKFLFSKLFAAQNSYQLSKKRLDVFLPLDSSAQLEKELYETQSSEVFFKEFPNTISIKDDDKWVIQSLPTDWVPNTSKSTVIERLHVKHCIKHQETVNVMAQKMMKINEYIEFGVRLRSQEIKEELESEKQNVQKFAEHVKNNLAQEIDSVFIDTEIENVKSNVNENSKKIQEYFEQLINLEKDRVIKIKVILREACNLLYQIGYIPPYEVQKFMENEIQKVNQTTLINFRMYEDVCFKLQIQNQTDVQNLILEIGNVKQKWRHRKKEQIFNRLLSTVEAKESEVENTLFMNTNGIKSIQSASKKDLIDKIIIKPPAHIRNHLIFQTIQNFGEEIQATINDLDTIAHDLVNMYKNTLNLVFNKFYVTINDVDSIKEIKEDLDFSSHISMESVSTHEDIVKTTAQEALEISFEEVLFIWNTVIDQLQTKLQENYAFVNDSCELWDSHINRVEANQNNIRQYLSTSYKAHDTLDFVYENKLNAKIDSLRDASTEIELEKNFNKVQELLKHKETMLKDNYKNEIEITKKYKNISQAGTKVTLSEIQQFFETHKIICSYGPNERIASKIPPHVRLPKQLKICDIQVASIANWRKGLSEKMENFKQKGVDESNEHVKKWMDEICKEIKERNYLKLLYHSERFDRMKNGIYKDRLLEIRVHFEIYRSHISAFHTVLQKLSVTITEIQNRDMTLLTDYHNDAIKLLARIAKVNTRIEMIQVTKEVDSMKLNAKNIINHFENSFHIRLNQCQDQTKHSNIIYLGSLKLFSDGGNYSTDEAEIYRNYLKKADFKINDDVKVLKNNVRKFIAYVKKKLRQILLRLYKSLEKYSFEVTFIDKVLHVLSNLQDEIKHSAYDIRSQAKRTTCTVDNIAVSLSQLNEDNLPSESTVEHLMIRIQKLMYDIENLTKYLTQQDAMLDEFPIFGSKNEYNTPKSTESDKRNRKIKLVKCRRCVVKAMVKSWCRYTTRGHLFAYKLMARKKDTFFPTDFRSVLFSWMPLHDSKSFIGYICHLVFEAFTTIQNLALRFYKAKFNSQILRRDLIQPSYETFMREIIYKCKYYHIQCEELWLSIVRDVVYTIDDLKNGFFKYANILFQKYGNKYFNDIDIMLNNFKESSRKDVIYREETWCTTRNQLKTLHGFPENIQLLHKLNTDVMACIIDMHKNPLYLKETNNLLSSLIAEFNNQMNSLHNKLCDLSKNLFNEPHTLNLMSEIYKLLENKKEGELQKGFGGSQLVVPEKYRINIVLDSKHQLLLSHAITDNEKTKIQKLLDDLRKKEDSFKFENKLMDTISMIDSNCGLIGDRTELNITCLWKNITKLFADKVNLLNLEIEIEKIILSKETDNWIENWMYDVEQIIKLYEIP